MEAVDVLVIGRSCLDYFAVVEHFPVENKKVPLVFKLIEAGGQGGTSSCCIAKLGGRVAYIGKLGDDDEGKFCLARLQDFNVNTDHIHIVKNGRTPVAHILVTRSNGNRTIVYEPSRLPKIHINAPVEKMASKAKVILLDPEVTYLGHQLKSITNHTGKIVYDAERWRDGMDDMMAAADYFIPASDFLDSKELPFNHLSLQEKIMELRKMVQGGLIVTAGADGAYFVDNEQLYQVPAPKISVRDTTGAGDNFHAAFALALSRKFEIAEAVKLSVAVASLSCRDYGGKNGIPEFQEATRAAETLAVNIVKPL
jgi:sulfofructose kinase